MGEAYHPDSYRGKDQEMPYFLTFQVVGWADVFSRKVYRDFILENLSYCRKEKGLYLYGYVIMSNHIHLVVQQKEGKLSEWGIDNLLCDSICKKQPAEAGVFSLGPVRDNSRE